MGPALDLTVAREAVRLALAEDIGTGDLTTGLTVTRDARTSARLIAKADGVIAGLAVAELAFGELDPAVRWQARVRDGQSVHTGDLLVQIDGLAHAILSAERTALNFLQRMSGIATATHELVKLVAGKATILDTRKTVPGLRALDKYAVGVGGARNHRFGLFDGILIKENHIRAAGGIVEAVAACRQGVPLLTKIEVEVTNFDELRQALDAGADVILLDNMSPAQMREAAGIAAGRAQLEASGGITRENLLDAASSGVDFISSGALTHSVKALDISLLVDL
ncbi:MAG TPA: carboxylating nicotinate-nucleotide diphosphorylase [Chloroflexota bacterium]|jgi:nicotinate-nucleotide pyrophosphorylase (carboxylating)|nr:carboxylating nicotinate-nucleotide diphosphorylase [Chloroflexota bacterium]